MARQIALQATFAGGEISPRLYGRTDIAKYQTAAEAIENFIPRPEGGLMRRHGTRYAGTVKTASAVTRLVPFIFSTTAAYIIEFGNLYCRFWKNYGQILSGPPVEIVTPYATADLPTLSFAQSADTLYIAHSGYAPRTLTRTSDTAWTLALIAQDKGPFTALNTDTAKHVMCVTNNFDPGDAVSVRSNADIFTANMVGSFLYMDERYYGDTAVEPWQAGADSGAGTGQQTSNNGSVYEKVAGRSNVNGSVGPVHLAGEAWDGNSLFVASKWRYLHSRYAIVSIDTFTDSKNVSGTIKTRLPDGLAPESINITNCTNSGGLIRVTTNNTFGGGDYVYISGVTGTTEANGSWQITNVTTTRFDLVGSAFVNAYTAGGTAIRYPTYKYRLSAFSAERGYPGAVTLHEQRLAWAATTLEPFGVWMSRTGDYVNYLPGTADADTIQYNIAAPQVNAIRWLESSDNMILGTLAQEFSAFGGGLGDPITPSNVRIVPQSNEGSAAVQPARAGNELVFINRSGRKLFALDYDSSTNDYQATDLAELANHLTATGSTFTRLAWARNPASILWVLRSDGVLCSLTYRKDQQVWAWARHPLGDGTVESIAVIPSPDGTVDDLWMIVNRTVNGATARYVEYLAQPFEPTSATDKSDMGFMDSALEYSGAPTTTLSGLSHLEAKTVKVVCNGALQPDKVVSGGAITVDVSTTQAWVGLAYTSRVRTLKPEIPTPSGTAQGKTKRSSRVIARVLNSLGGRIGPSTETVMEDLLGRDMAGLTDVSPPLKSGDYEVNVASDYDLGGQIAIVQTEPLPLDVLSVMMYLTVSEA